MGRSLVAKRRLRCLQKARKRKVKRQGIDHCDGHHQTTSNTSKETEEESRYHITQSLLASPSSPVPQTNASPGIPPPSMSCLTSDDDTFGSPGSPPPTPSSCIEWDDSQLSGDEIGSSQDLSIQAMSTLPDAENNLHATVDSWRRGIFFPPQEKCCRCVELKEQLEYADYQIHYYQKKLVDEERRLKEDFNKRVRSVRHFWKDMIYMECSRSGKIFKLGLQAALAN